MHTYIFTYPLITYFTSKFKKKNACWLLVKDNAEKIEHAHLHSFFK